MQFPKITTLQPHIAALDTRAAKPWERRADAIYSTPEYRWWRADVIRRAGGKCEAKGCHRSEPRMFADHIVELKDGGAAFDLANGQCLCGSCHTAKTIGARARRNGAAF